MPVVSSAHSVGRSGNPGSPGHTSATLLLTGRERQVLAQRAAGRTIAEIAASLVIEPRTVRFHLRQLYAKLGVNGGSQVTRQRSLVECAERLGLAGAPPEEALAQQRADLARQGKELFDASVRTLATTIEQRSPPTFHHSRRVAFTAEIIAAALGLPSQDVEKLRVAGLLHDIGKIGVPEAVLNKPGRLTDEEFFLLRRHAAVSRLILDQLTYPPGYEDIPVIVGQHHERLSGAGYPGGEVGDAITLGARVLAVADIYDALRTTFPPRVAMTLEQARDHFRASVDRGDLDPAVVQALETRQLEIERVCAPERS